MIEYMKQISHLISVSPQTVINLINGEISYLPKDCLKMEQRITLFNFFLIKSDIHRHTSTQSLINSKFILLTLLCNKKKRLHIFRHGDLTDDNLRIIKKILSFVEKKDLIKIKSNKYTHTSDILHLMDNSISLKSEVKKERRENF
jgi:hypothetical protein